MKNRIMQIIFFLITVVLLFIIFFNMAGNAKIDKFYKNEILVLDINEVSDDGYLVYPNVIMNNVSTKLLKDPIYFNTLTTGDSSFDLSVYYYKKNGAVNLLFFVNNPNIYVNSEEITTFSIVFDIHINSKEHDFSQTMSFNSSKNDVHPYFIFNENSDELFSVNINNSAVTFTEILNINATIKHSIDGAVKVIGTTKVDLDENVLISSTKDDLTVLNSKLENYKNASLDLTDADNSLFKKYNSTFAAYMIVYAVVIIFVGLFMFLSEQIKSFFRKIFKKKPKTVSGTIE